MNKWMIVRFLLVMAVMASLVLPPFAGAEQSLDMLNSLRPVGGLAVRTPSKPMEMLSGSEAQDLNEKMAGYAGQEKSLLINNARNYYYYNNLEPVAKEIYDVMYGVAQDPVNAGNVGLIMTVVDPQSDEFYFAFNVAYRALCFDHPELFWLYAGQEAEMCYASEAISQHGFYFVYIMMQEPFLNFEAQMTAFNNATQAFLADINTGISEYETVRQIHDKLIALVNYNDPVGNHQVYSSRGQDLAHTAYGALVTDTAGNPNYAVCDGYTLAFEYLLQQCGIDAVFIGGKAGSDEFNVGGHAWSMVKVDNVWYEVDSTWNDSGSMIDDLTPGTTVHKYVTEALSDPVYRAKLDHYLFLVSTDRIRHFLPGDEYDYITKDRTMVYQLAQESVHIRLTLDGYTDSMNPDPTVISLAPIAMESYRW